MTKQEIEGLKLRCAHAHGLPFALNGDLQPALDRLVKLEEAVAFKGFDELPSISGQVVDYEDSAHIRLNAADGVIAVEILTSIKSVSRSCNFYTKENSFRYGFADYTPAEMQKEGFLGWRYLVGDL